MALLQTECGPCGTVRLSLAVLSINGAGGGINPLWAAFGGFYIALMHVGKNV